MEAEPAKDLDLKEQEEYIQLCEKEFRDLSGIIFAEGTLEFYFKPETGRTKGWLIQLAFVYRRMQSLGVNHLLLELYYEEPDHLYRQFQIARHLSERVPIRCDPISNPWTSDPRYEKLRNLFQVAEPVETTKYAETADHSLTEALKLPQYGLFLLNLHPFEKGKEAIIERLALETAALVLKRYHRFKAFKKYMDLYWSPIEFEERTNGRTTLFTGLHRIASTQTAQFWELLADRIKRWTPLAGARAYMLHEHAAKPVFSKTSTVFDKKPVQFAFSPSGSGKTTSIFDELKQHYGYYMVACALPRTDLSSSARDSSRMILQPKVQRGVSRDTSYLFYMLEYIQSRKWNNVLKSVDLIDWIRVCQDWWYAILETRYEIFECFLVAQRANPELWLLFQLDCYEYDCFLDLFRLISLFPSYTHKLGRPIDATFKVGRGKIRRICLDEAQEDLLITPLTGNKSPWLSLLGMAMITIRNMFQGSIQMYDLPVPQTIFAGTSLNAQKAIQARAEYLDEEVRLGFRDAIKEDYNVVANFSFVRSKNDAINVLRYHNLSTLESTRAADDSWPLWGRVKWTAMYAERIVEELKRADKEGVGFDTTLDFPALVEDVYKTIIENLYAKLESLQKRKGGAEVIDKLLEAAIAADILDRDHIFHRESDMQLVEDGFAVIESGIDRLMDELKNEPEKPFEIVKKSKNQLMVKLSDNPESPNLEDRVVDLFFKVKQRGFAIADCTTTLTPESLELFKGGFTILECPIHALATELRRKGFIINGHSTTELEAKLSDDIPTESFMADVRMQELYEVLSDFEEGGYRLYHTRDRGNVTIQYDYDESNLRGELEYAVKESGFILDPEPTDLDDETGEMDVEAEEMDSEAEETDFSFPATDCFGPIEPRRKRVKRQKNLVYARPRDTGSADTQKLMALLHERGVLEYKDLAEEKLSPKHKSFIIVNKAKDKLVRLFKDPVIIIGRTTDRVTAKMAEDGFFVFGNYKDPLIPTLKRKGYSVKEEVRHQLMVQWKDPTPINRNLDELAAILHQKGLAMTSKDETSLVARLAERVVIDAVIRFSMGQRLDEKMTDYVRMAAARSGIGHMAEQYLAVQLRQCFSTPPRFTGPMQDWNERRNRVLDALAQADNCFEVKDSNADKVNSDSIRTVNAKIGSLQDYTLVEGDQTIKTFSSEQIWLDTFLAWLHTVQGGQKPRASFLIPDNDFGPDLVFAIRHRDENKVVLCSIQAKLSKGNADAINKSSISWACASRRRPEKEKKEGQDHERVAISTKERDDLRNLIEEMGRDVAEVEKSKDWYKHALELMAGELRVKEEKLESLGVNGEEGMKGAVLVKNGEGEAEGSKDGDAEKSKNGMELVEDVLNNEWWKKQPRLSLLIAGGKGIPGSMARERPYTKPRDPQLEFFAYIDRERGRDLLGETFINVLEALQK